MTDPAASRAFRQCKSCFGWTRADLAGDPPRCNCCGSLVEVPANAPTSPIVARSIYRSASLRRTEPQPIT